MTHVLIFKSSDGKFKGFNCLGHAEYDEYGSDIVCASVSVLVINTINSLEELTDQKFTLTVNEEEGLIHCEFISEADEHSELLMKSMILGLEGIKQEYGKQYLDLTFEEV